MAMNSFEKIHSTVINHSQTRQNLSLFYQGKHDNKKVRATYLSERDTSLDAEWLMDSFVTGNRNQPSNQASIEPFTRAKTADYFFSLLDLPQSKA